MLITKSELAKLLNTSTRTIDRWRSAGIDLGEVKTPGTPRFNPVKVKTMIDAGVIGRKRKKSRAPLKNL